MNAIQWLREIPQKYGDKEFLIDTISGTTMTFADVHEKASAVAAELRRRGINKGDRVGMALNNSKAFAELYFGCLYAGAVAVPINPILSRKELTYLLGSSDASSSSFLPRRQSRSRSTP